MTRILIGIHSDGCPQRLEATLSALCPDTAEAYELLLLLDGAALPALPAVERTAQSSTSDPVGCAACFNRLVSSRPADFYVFLESGVVVGPGWLDHLLA